MKQAIGIFLGMVLTLQLAGQTDSAPAKIYHRNWIDLNKNGKKMCMKMGSSLLKSGWRIYWGK